MMSFFKETKIHFVGIGGVGMSGIAEVLHNMGYTVTGSDIKENENIIRLRKSGIIIWLTHSAKNIEDCDVVVRSSAVPDNNPEIKKAVKLKIPIIQRAEMLAELMRLKKSICIAGAHGKTTTTSMVGKVLIKANLDPTVIVGGRVLEIGSGSYYGEGEYLVAEADESDGSFLKLYPVINVITNIDNDHLDYYKNLNRIKKAFVNYIDKIPFYGSNIVCIDDDNIKSIIKKCRKRIITYGFSNNADYKISDYKLEEDGASYKVLYKERLIGDIKLRIFGRHNVLNSLAALIVGLELNIPFDIIKDALKEFTGVHRRFEFKGRIHNTIVIDDYGHHPTEIYNTVKTARQIYKDKKIIVFFQPHRYTRTYYLKNEFVNAFKYADEIVLFPLYAASEKPIKGISTQTILELLKENTNKKVMYFETFEELILKFNENFSVIEDNLFLTLGAGNISSLSEKILEEIKHD